ncbi:MAG: response regulator [Phycisphaerae bacterium]|nr:response regulator [Phycisphaerae bacterium]
MRPDQPLTILLAEDDGTTRRIITQYLTHSHYEVHSAKNGLDALKIIREVGPPLVLTDWMMPEMDGIEFCRRIRSEEGVGFTYVIFLTALNDRAKLVEAFEAGADDYISKPIDERELLARIEAAERIIRLEWDFQRQCGQLHKYNAQIAVLNSQLVRTNRQLSDAREQARAGQEAAEFANRMKTEFLASISHGIRTPMMSILGYGEALLGDELSPSERRRALTAVRRNGEHLMQIVDDLLDIALIEAGKLRLQLTSARLKDTVEEIVTLLTPRASAGRLQLDVQYSDGLPETFLTDVTRLRQILLNLIQNAIKFTMTGGVTVRVGTEPAGDSRILVLEVIDTGIGIPQDQLAQICEALARTDAPFVRRRGGVGLGLRISKRLVELLGGEIAVQSKKGVGTTFRVSLPLQESPRAEAPAPSTASNAARSKPRFVNQDDRPCRVLVVDDSPDNAALVTHLLRRAGADVAVAENGRESVTEALTAVQCGRPYDVVLMDMQMPVMDGYEATRELRRRGYAGPIVALTAHAMAEDRQHCLEAGCDEYLAKPVSRGDLLAAVQGMLSRRAGRFSHPDVAPQFDPSIP